MNGSRRRQRLHKGRWELARERLRIEDERPAPPDREPVAVAPLVDGIVKRLGLAARVREDAIVLRWAEVVGPVVAAHARPGKLDRGRLIVFADSAVWVSEIRRYLQQPLLVRLQAEFPALGITSLSVQPDPG